jgi:hypothetical protein
MLDPLLSRLTRAIKSKFNKTAIMALKVRVCSSGATGADGADVMVAQCLALLVRLKLPSVQKQLPRMIRRTFNLIQVPRCTCAARAGSDRWGVHSALACRPATWCRRASSC